MHHAKFQYHLVLEKIFKGSYHMISTDHLYNFYPKRLHLKSSFNWSSGFRREDFENCGQTNYRLTTDHWNTCESLAQGVGGGGGG